MDPPAGLLLTIMARQSESYLIGGKGREVGMRLVRVSCLSSWQENQKDRAKGERVGNRTAQLVSYRPSWQGNQRDMAKGEKGGNGTC